MVFADLVGSTELATDLDPEELRQRLAPFFEVARATLEEHGGRVEKYVGDAVMAVFGVPRSYGDDPDRAVAAALALRDRVGALGDGLTLRVGVETGEVLAFERGRRPLGHRRGGQRSGSPAAGGRTRRGPGRRANGGGLSRRRARGPGPDRREGLSGAPPRLARRGRERPEAAGDDALRGPAGRPRPAAAGLPPRRPRAGAGAGHGHRRGRHRQDEAGRRAGRRAARGSGSADRAPGPQPAVRPWDRLLGARGDPASRGRGQRRRLGRRRPRGARQTAGRSWAPTTRTSSPPPWAWPSAAIR